jgi:hypothetical protein
MAGMDASAADPLRRYPGRWYTPAPAWLVWGAAVATGVLYACERWRWFPVGYQKGWPVLFALAVVATVLALILAWMLVGLVFRRRVQFGLRTLLVFVTLCAVVCSWMAVRIKQARRQAEVVAALQAKGRAKGRTRVFYDWECADYLHVRFLKGPPPGSEFLRNVLGVDFFFDVEYLPLRHWPVADADLAQLIVFTRVTDLEVAGDKITNEGLPYLEQLTSLRTLSLDDTQITYLGMRSLQFALPRCYIYVNGKPY